MADLDDFFAKKDRKKSKSVKKFATADELAKKMDDTKQKIEVKPRKERQAQDGEEGGRVGEEEEWKEYEEPVKDYSGLKIQVLQGGNGGQGESRDATSEDSAPDNGKVKGPWNKPVETEPAPAAPAPVEEKVRESKPAAYVPPVARQRPVETQRRSQKHAPDIHNDDYFPVLGASGKKPPGGAGGWSTAGGAAPHQRTASRQPLSLGNRFTSLQDDS